ncbi:MAG: helix-turn-helix domain-containing protein [Rickettsiales bacterium]|nr:helix-turn-helix domain-containing protein [Rickettsiales bacterium]
MEEAEYQNTMQAIKAVMNAINSVQKIIMVGTEFVILPKQQFDEIVSVAELLFKSGKRLNYLEHKIDQVQLKQSSAAIEAAQADNKNPDALLTQKQVASEWGITVKALEKWRFSGGGPTYVKLGESRCAAVRYRRKDIKEYVENFMREHTTQHSNMKP